jgi:basic membrane protein A and related proteins
MLKKGKMLGLVLFVMLVGLLFAGCDNAANTDGEDKAVKVALLLPGNINDAGWSQAAYNGLMDAQKEYDIETSYIESVPLAEQESTIRDYASRGFDLIICHGSDFKDAIFTVAPEFPDTGFAITNSPGQGENLVGVGVQNEEQGYMAGYALGLVTKANKVGYVASNEGLAMKRTENGFIAGVKASNPGASVITAYTGSFDDAAKGKETALAIFDKGVDCVFQFAQGSGIGVIQAAAEKNVPIVVTSPSQVKIAPNQAVLSVMSDMKVNILAVITAYVEGEFGPDLKIVGSFQTGLYKVSDINEKFIGGDSKVKVEAAIKDLQAGKITFK